MSKGEECLLRNDQASADGKSSDRNLRQPGLRPQEAEPGSTKVVEELTCSSRNSAGQDAQAGQPSDLVSARGRPQEDSAADQEAQPRATDAGSASSLQPEDSQEPGQSDAGAEPAGHGEGQQQQQGHDSQPQQPQQGQEQQERQQQEQQEERCEGDGPQGHQMSEADVAEALARAESLKREGNELFGRGRWKEAAAKYNAALDAAPPSAHKEQAIYFANLAACNIKAQQYAVAVQNCTEAIQLDTSYQKAYMRRCEAFERLDELDHALSDAKKLLELAPDSAWARAKVEVLQPKVDERTEKLKTEMFSKLKDLGDTILGKFGLSTDNFKFDKDPATGGYNIRFER